MGDNNGIKHEVFSVKDELTGRFLEPVFMENDKVATRWFKYVLNKNDMWRSNAAMYSLYHLGSFNDKEGLADYNVCEMVCGGVSVLEEK